MRIDRLRTFVKVMKRAEQQEIVFDMTSWMDCTPDRRIPKNLWEFLDHKCGTTCCAGGWLALSKEWIDTGGSSNKEGAPVYRNCRDYDALNGWFEAETRKERDFIESMFYPDISFYDVDSINDVTISMVIGKTVEFLEELETTWEFSHGRIS